MNYQKIYSFDLANGPGVRVSLFVSGCSLHCPGCFNQEAWDFCSGKPFTEEHMNAIKEILNDEKYAGLSILGGEPFDQDKKGLKQLIKLCKYAHKQNKTVWIWTGHLISELESKHQKRLLKYCDVVVEGPYKKELKTFDTPFIGSSNQKIISVDKNKNI